jgi:hypothetical protein
MPLKRLEVIVPSGTGPVEPAVEKSTSEEDVPTCALQLLYNPVLVNGDESNGTEGEEEQSLPTRPPSPHYPGGEEPSSAPDSLPVDQLSSAPPAAEEGILAPEGRCDQAACISYNPATS